MLLQGDFDNLTDYTGYLVARRQEIESMSDTHRKWYTHKNPYGCWICDMFQLMIQWEDLYYPSPLKSDMNKDSESNDVSDNDEVEIKSDS